MEWTTAATSLVSLEVPPSSLNPPTTTYEYKGQKSHPMRTAGIESKHPIATCKQRGSLWTTHQMFFTGILEEEPIKGRTSTSEHFHSKRTIPFRKIMILVYTSSY